jgi:hypothetical protein
MRGIGAALTALLLAGSVGGFFAWRRHTEPARAWTEFLELEGVDIPALTGRSRERAELLFDRFAPRSGFGSDVWGYPSWRVIRFSKGSSEEVVAVALECEFENDSKLRVVHFWRMRRPGWRTLSWHAEVAPADVRARRRPEAGVVCLEIVMQDGTLFCFAIRDDGCIPVRFESAEGILKTWPDGLASPVPRRETSAEWARALEASDTPERLCRLSWLGVRAGGAPHPLIRLQLESEAVQKALRDLRWSPNRWVREAAELALRP